MKLLIVIALWCEQIKIFICYHIFSFWGNNFYWRTIYICKKTKQMSNIADFYSWGRYSTAKNIVSLAKKIVYEDEVSIVDNGDGSYTLMIENKEIGTINTANSSSLDVSYDSDTHVLTITYTSNGTENSNKIDLSEFVTSFKAGNGIEIDSDNQFSVVIDSNSDEYLTVSADGILLSGVKDAIEEEASARKEADDAIEERTDDLENWVDAYSLSSNEIDEIIINVENSTKYGMADAMGVENNIEK